MNRDRVYRKIGEAVHLSQALETNIRALIEVVNQRCDAHIDERQIILAEDRHTLGRLIDELKQHGDLGQGFKDTLSEALAARNYIAHDFFIRNVGAFRDEAGCVSALQLLAERTKEIAVAAVVTSGFVKSFSATFNVKLSDVVVRQDT